jgi:transposase
VQHIGIDLHKRESQICWVDAATGEVRQQRIQTRRDRFEAVLGHQAPGQVLIEAGTESEWVAQVVEGLGHRVWVVDPSYAPMYPRRRGGRHKNDPRDAAALAEASLRGTYRPVHRVSRGRRVVRQALTVREALVRTRTRLIATIRAAVRAEGLRVASGQTESFVARLQVVALPADLAETLAPLVAVLGDVETALTAADAQVAAHVAQDADMQRLQTAPRIGPVTSAAFVATLDTPTRFAHAGQVASYLGLAPRDDSSGDRRRAGHISKAGPSRLRWLLVQAGWGILCGAETEGWALHTWAVAVAARRGKRIAAVALARRLARILYAMWRDGTEFDRTAPRTRTAASALAA